MTSNPLALSKLPVLVFWSFVSIFVYCDSGERLVSEFNKFDVYCLCEWYMFPLFAQRSLPMIILNTQQPVVLQGFGSVQCTRETFRRVMSFNFWPLQNHPRILCFILHRIFVCFRWWMLAVRISLSCENSFDFAVVRVTNIKNHISYDYTIFSCKINHFQKYDVAKILNFLCENVTAKVRQKRV